MAGMTEADLVNVRAVLEQYGQATVALMREKLTEVRQRRSADGRLLSLRTNAVATGNLERSLVYAVEWAGRNFEIEFGMADYGKFVDKGRGPGKMPPIDAIKGPGKMPPIDAIKEWARVRGLPERIAFPVARRIGREGTAARPFFGSSVDEGIEGLVRDIQEAYARDAQAFLDRQTGG